MLAQFMYPPKKKSRFLNYLLCIIYVIALEDCEDCIFTRQATLQCLTSPLFQIFTLKIYFGHLHYNGFQSFGNSGVLDLPD